MFVTLTKINVSTSLTGYVNYFNYIQQLIIIYHTKVNSCVIILNIMYIIYINLYGKNENRHVKYTVKRK